MAASDISAAPALAMRGVSKRFGDLQALDAVDLEVAPGEVLALLGENGAGKTTLMRIASGLEARDAGTIEVGGLEVPLASPHEALEHRISMVHQHFLLVGNLTVAENVVLGSRADVLPVSKRQVEREVEEVAERIGMRLEAGRRVDELSIDERAKAEIVKALYHGARILILDEPTSSLGPKQIDDLLATVKTVAAEGMAVILVTHRLAEIRRVSSRVVVLRHGKVAASGTTETYTDDALARAMIGHELPPRAIPLSAAPRETVRLRVENLVVRDHERVALDGVSFDVSPGRILGVVGVEGNGQTELVEVLAGLRRPDEGRILCDDVDVTTLGPDGLHEHGVVTITGDRGRWDVIGPMTIAENLALHRIARRGYRGRGGLISWRAVEEDAERLAADFDIRPRRVDARVEQLSGGNQQKVVMARAMALGPRVLVLGHPTRGLDIGARRFIYDQIVRARDEGVAVVLLSFDLEELLEHSDDILVLFRGAISYQARRQDATLETVGNAMTGIGLRLAAPAA